MSRIQISPNQSVCIVDATNSRVGFSIQNPSSVDVYYSEDQRILDTVSTGNLPGCGHLLAAAVPVPPPTVYPRFANKKIYARAVSAGATLEVIIYPIDLPCK